MARRSGRVNERRPTPADHDRFCRTEGWISVRAATHITYELGLPDGRVLRTRLSSRDSYGSDLWRHILRDQLEVDEPAFWACVHDEKRGNSPDRRLLGTVGRDGVSTAEQALLEKPDHWVLPYAGMAVIQFRVGYQLTLDLDGDR